MFCCRSSQRRGTEVAGSCARHTGTRWILVPGPAKHLEHPVRKSHALTEGKTHENVLLEMYLAQDGSGRRLRPLNTFPADIKVEFPEKRLADFPPGTFFRATTQVCQEHWPQTGKHKGDPYVVASNIYVHRTEDTPDTNEDRQRDRWEKIS